VQQKNKHTDLDRWGAGNLLRSCLLFLFERHSNFRGGRAEIIRRPSTSLDKQDRRRLSGRADMLQRGSQ
jgi:hypothetical protein